MNGRSEEQGEGVVGRCGSSTSKHWPGNKKQQYVVFSMSIALEIQHTLRVRPMQCNLGVSVHANEPGALYVRLQTVIVGFQSAYWFGYVHEVSVLVWGIVYCWWYLTSGSTQPEFICGIQFVLKGVLEVWKGMFMRSAVVCKYSVRSGAAVSNLSGLEYIRGMHGNSRNVCRVCLVVGLLITLLWTCCFHVLTG